MKRLSNSNRREPGTCAWYVFQEDRDISAGSVLSQGQGGCSHKSAIFENRFFVDGDGIAPVSRCHSLYKCRFFCDEEPNERREP